MHKPTDLGKRWIGRYGRMLAKMAKRGQKSLSHARTAKIVNDLAAMHIALGMITLPEAMWR